MDDAQQTSLLTLPATDAVGYQAYRLADTGLRFVPDRPPWWARYWPWYRKTFRVEKVLPERYELVGSWRHQQMAKEAQTCPQPSSP